MDVSSAISNGFNMIASAYNAAAASSMDTKTRTWNTKIFNQANQFNHDEAILAYERAKKEWDRQFNLSTPAAQMERFARAGINPYMALSSLGNPSSVSGVNAPSASSASAPYNSPFSNFGSNFLNSLNQSSDAALKILDMTTNSATLPLKIDTSKKILESEGVKAVYDKTYNTLKLANVPNIVAQELAQLEAQTEYQFNQVDLSRATAEEKREMVRWLHNTYSERVDSICYDNDMKKAQIHNIYSTLEMARKMNTAQIRYTDANIKHLDFQNRLLTSQGRYYDALKDLTDEQYYGLTLDNTFGKPLNWQLTKNQIRSTWHQGSKNFYDAKRASILSPEEFFYLQGSRDPAAGLLFGVSSAAHGIGSIANGLMPIRIGFPRK